MKKLIGCLISTMVFVLLSVASYSQMNTLKGVVKEAEVSMVLPGVSIRLTDAQDPAKVYGAYTNNRGEYAVKNVPNGEYSLSISLIGYKDNVNETRVIKLSGGEVKNLNFELLADAIKMGDVIVTASRKKEKVIDAPASTTVIDAKQIERTNALTAVENVRGTAGVDIAQKGVVQQEFVSRGFNNVFNGTMLTLIDGRIAGLPSLKANVSYLMPVSSSDIERIEIVRGPASALYGPNTTNGVLNIITKSPFAYKGTDVSLILGEQSLMQGALRHSGTLGDNFGYKISGQYTSAKDWSNPDTSLTLSDEIANYNFDARMDYILSENTNFNISGGYANSIKNNDLTDVGIARADNFSYLYGQARFRSGDLFAQFYYNKNDAGKTYVIRTGQAIVDKSSKLGAHLQHQSKLGTFMNLTYGGDLFLTNPETEGTINGRFENEDNINEYGVYIQSETSILKDKLNLIIAGRYDLHSELSEGIFSPRLGLQFKPSENHNIRLTYNKAFYTPVSSDLFIDLLGMENVFGFPNDYSVDLRLHGVPKDGFHFTRNNGSLLFNSRFGDPSQAIPVVGAALLWDAAASIVASQIEDEDMRQLIMNIPAPDPTMIGHNLAYLDIETGGFKPISDAIISDIEGLKPTLNSTYELGYKGVLADKIEFAFDVYYSEVSNFLTSPQVISPNVFLNGDDVANYTNMVIYQFLLSQGMPEEQAQATAGQYSGMLGAAFGSVPLGTVNPDEVLRKTDIHLASKNYGDINYYGADFSILYHLSNRLDIGGTYSYMSENFFSNVDGYGEMSLNAPKHKASASVNYSFPDLGMNFGLRYRWVDAYKIRSAVFHGDIDPYGLVDFMIQYHTPISGLTAVLNISNLLDHKHLEYIGASQIGRLTSLKLMYRL